MIFKRLINLFKLNRSKASPQIRTGIIRYFDPKRGIGYIYSDELLKDVRVAQADANESLKAGVKVQFQLKSIGKNYIARKVIIVK